MTVRYIGSKARLIDVLGGLIGPPSSRSGYFVDAFCGTGAVAETAATLGWRVKLNDHLASAVAMSHARLVTRHAARFSQIGGYESAIEALNRTRPLRGFIWREYSPASRAHLGFPRMYFSEENGARIDGARRQIGRWWEAGLLSVSEYRLLIADLLLAANHVANIAGTYGCFLSHWSSQSRQVLHLTPRKLFPLSAEIRTSITDVAKVSVGPDDVVYLDPPYTKRHYAAYYHILETITAGDAPQVSGITGLRPWREKASDFCYRTRALAALTRLIERQPARRILLSYSDHGHVPLQPLSEALSPLGRLTVVPLKELGKYRPNRAARDNGSHVTEYLLTLDRPNGRRARLRGRLEASQ